MGPRGRPWVPLLTYMLTALELTCLFMQFSILPVSTSFPGSLATSWPSLALSPSRRCQGAGVRPLSLGALCHTEAKQAKGLSDCAS